MSMIWKLHNNLPVVRALKSAGKIIEERVDEVLSVGFSPGAVDCSKDKEGGESDGLMCYHHPLSSCQQQLLWSERSDGLCKQSLAELESHALCNAGTHACLHHSLQFAIAGEH